MSAPQLAGRKFQINAPGQPWHGFQGTAQEQTRQHVKSGVVMLRLDKPLVIQGRSCSALSVPIDNLVAVKAPTRTTTAALGIPMKVTLTATATIKIDPNYYGTVDPAELISAVQDDLSHDPGKVIGSPDLSCTVVCALVPKPISKTKPVEPVKAKPKMKIKIEPAPEPEAEEPAEETEEPVEPPPVPDTASEPESTDGAAG